MTCTLVGCAQTLTRKQLGRGSRYCSYTCMGLARRHPHAPRPTHCKVYATPLTWAQARIGEHCSIGCAMRTRHGTPAPDRTACSACGHPLTRKQRWRRRTFCSKACAKAIAHQARPDILRKGQARLKVVSRERFVQRLRAFLLACPSKPLAGQKGWRNGWSAARRQALAVGAVRREGRFTAAHRAVVSQTAAAAPTKAEAYRRCYQAAWAACWRIYVRRWVAA